MGIIDSYLKYSPIKMQTVIVVTTSCISTVNPCHKALGLASNNLEVANNRDPGPLEKNEFFIKEN